MDSDLKKVLRYEVLGLIVLILGLLDLFSTWNLFLIAAGWYILIGIVALVIGGYLANKMD